jgi:hypothetical protein
VDAQCLVRKQLCKVLTLHAIRRISNNPKRANKLWIQKAENLRNCRIIGIKGSRRRWRMVMSSFLKSWNGATSFISYAHRILQKLMKRRRNQSLHFCLWFLKSFVLQRCRCKRALLKAKQIRLKQLSGKVFHGWRYCAHQESTMFKSLGTFIRRMRQYMDFHSISISRLSLARHNNLLHKEERSLDYKRIVTLIFSNPGI